MTFVVLSMGMSFIVSAVDSVKQHIRPPAMIVLESTTYSGTPDELVVAELKSVGLTSGPRLFRLFLAGAGRSGQRSVSDA